jgi:polysaccharide biosynthesis/export protein
MKAIRLLYIFSFICASAFVCVAQQDKGDTTTSVNQIGSVGVGNYLIGPGDLLKVTVLGEDGMNGDYEVNGEGFVEFPFVDNPIQARCRTDREVRADLVTALKKYIRNPQVNIRVSEKRSRPPAVIIGAVQNPQQFILNRRVRLMEIISWAGGAIKGESAGSLQIFHTTPVLCPVAGEEELAKLDIKDNMMVPSNIYDLNSVSMGKPETNPYVYPGDIIVVPKAPPVYIGGLVGAPQGIYWSENLTLTQAIAMVGNVRKEAKLDKVIIRRLKQGSSTEREIIATNYKQIQKGQAKDMILQPYDIVEVDEASPWSREKIGQTLIGLVTGGAGSAISSIGQLPLRVVY